MTREIQIGGLAIGAGHPIAIQSMTTTDTKDVEHTVEQILGLEQAGCEIIRVAAYDQEAARCIQRIKERIHIPIVADVHFDYRIAICAMEHGADKVRINPGNIGTEEKIKKVVDAAKAHHVPIRVGANSGSIAKELKGAPKIDALIQSALGNIQALERYGFTDIVVSLKSSDVRECIAANEKMHQLVDYPLHLGVTEAGTLTSSTVKSAMGIGALLAQGIGDTIRVSVSGDPLEEIPVAKDILRYLKLRQFGPEIISCPTCARCSIDIKAIAQEIGQYAQKVDKPLKIAVMGCIVNGPGEAADADFGIAGGGGSGILFQKGQVIKKVPMEQIVGELKALIDQSV